MTKRPTLCVIFEAIGPYSAIGRVAMGDVRIALDSGWEVTVVAKRLHESLHGDVEWLHLYVPPRLFYLQWATARHYIRKALGDRKFDVVHAHQPQVADLADVFQCHYLTRAAFERDCLTDGHTLRSAAVRLQELGVLRLEDRCYRRWNPGTRMLYDSDLTRDDFHRLYGSMPRDEVMVYAMPALCFPTDAERTQARDRLVGNQNRGPVLGFLGGLHERKGYRRLLRGLEGNNDVFLLMGGQYSDGFDAPSLAGRFKAVGLVSDLKSFYHACDAFIVPSHYEPLGLVGFEAAAHGVPVIATEEVGALPHLLEYDAGDRWGPSESLSGLVTRLTARRLECQGGARRMAAALGEDAYSDRLLRIYSDVSNRKMDVPSRPANGILTN